MTFISVLFVEHLEKLIKIFGKTGHYVWSLSYKSATSSLNQFIFIDVNWKTFRKFINKLLFCDSNAEVYFPKKANSN